jgi:hypothetical protein
MFFLDILFHRMSVMGMLRQLRTSNTIVERLPRG